MGGAGGVAGLSRSAPWMQPRRPLARGAGTGSNAALLRPRRGIHLCGHSAGAHLAAMMLLADWTERGVTPNLKGFLLQPPPRPPSPSLWA